MRKESMEDRGVFYSARGEQGVCQNTKRKRKKKSLISRGERTYRDSESRLGRSSVGGRGDLLRERSTFFLKVRKEISKKKGKLGKKEEKAPDHGGEGQIRCREARFSEEEGFHFGQ